MNPRRAIRVFSILAVVLGVLAFAKMAIDSSELMGEKLPPLLADLPAQDVPGSFEQGDAMFNIRLAETFPPGTSVKTLVEKLTADGFAIAAGKATREAEVYLCRVNWVVTWADLNGSVSDLAGEYSGACM